MKVTIAQPSFFPNLHLFKRIMDCDVWVVMESAQFVRRLPWAAHESCMIKDRSGKVAKISVPVKHVGQRQSLKEAEIVDKLWWEEEALKKISGVYKDASLFEVVSQFIRDLFYRHKELEKETLGQFNARTMIEILNRLGSKTEVLYDDKFDTAGKTGSDWILKICQDLKATEYFCGTNAVENYLTIKDFEDKGIKVTGQNWTCPEYKQLYGAFIPNLSIIDLLMNIGFENAKAFFSANIDNL